MEQLLDLFSMLPCKLTGASKSNKSRDGDQDRATHAQRNAHSRDDSTDQADSGPNEGARESDHQSASHCPFITMDHAAYQCQQSEGTVALVVMPTPRPTSSAPTVVITPPPAMQAAPVATPAKAQV